MVDLLWFLFLVLYVVYWILARIDDVSRRRAARERLARRRVAGELIEELRARPWNDPELSAWVTTQIRERRLWADERWEVQRCLARHRRDGADRARAQERREEVELLKLLWGDDLPNAGPPSRQCLTEPRQAATEPHPWAVTTRTSPSYGLGHALGKRLRNKRGR